MRQLEHVSAQAVFQVGYLALALDLDPAVGHSLRRGFVVGHCSCTLLRSQESNTAAAGRSKATIVRSSGRASYPYVLQTASKRTRCQHPDIPISDPGADRAR